MNKPAVIPLRNFIQVEMGQWSVRGGDLLNDLAVKSPIVHPGDYLERARVGKVIALGNGNMQDGEQWIFTVKPGDTILYPRYDGVEVERSEEEVLFFIKEEEVLARVNR